MLRFLLVEAAQVTVRSMPEWRSQYFRLMLRRGRKTAKVSMARRLAIRLYWMWRQGWNYQQWKKFGSHAGQPWKSRWCAAKHRVIDWASCSPAMGSLN
jgi:transposase